jgi:hypothetical protein
MYCLPVNLDLVTHALADETPDLVYYLDLETGGIFSVVQPDDVCSISEDLDHSVVCNLSRFPERFVTLAWPWHEDKSALIREFISTLPRSYFKYQFRRAVPGWTTFTEVEAALAGFPEEGAYWRKFLRGRLHDLALETLVDNEVEVGHLLRAEGTTSKTGDGALGKARADIPYVYDNLFLKEDRIYGCHSENFSLRELAGHVEGVGSMQGLTELVGRLLVNRESNSYRYVGYPVWPFLDAVAWCLDDLEHYLDCRGEPVPEEPDWRLLAWILFASLYRDTPEFEAWLSGGSGRARVLPGPFSPGR